MEGVEVHYPLEAAVVEIREFHCADGDPAQGTGAQSRGYSFSTAAAVLQEPRAAGVISANAAAPPSLRVRIPPQELVRRRYSRCAAQAGRRAVSVRPSRRPID